MPNKQSPQRTAGVPQGAVLTAISQAARALCRCLAAWPVAILALSIMSAAFAREQPLWEAAIGVLPSTFPAYRGSDEQDFYLFPFPYLIYRGEILQSDRNGIRALLFHSDRVELNVSTNAALNARSDNNAARRGMPNLDPTLEIGPALSIRLATLSAGSTLRLKLPVRSVIAADFGNVQQVGWVFHPHLNLDSQNNWGGWNFGLDIGPLFATRKYHDYYYRVKPAFALPDRPAYQPSAGYSGAVGLASFSRRFNDYWLGGFVRYDYLGGTEFGNSPLVETNHSIMGGIAIAWFFAKSSRQVEY